MTEDAQGHYGVGMSGALLCRMLNDELPSMDVHVRGSDGRAQARTAIDPRPLANPGTAVSDAGLRR